VDEDLRVGGGYLVQVGIQLRLYVDCGGLGYCNGWEQTGLVHVAELGVRLTRQMMGTRTHGDEGGLEVFIFPRVISAELVGFLAVDGEEVGSRTVLPQRFEELFECGS